MRYRAEHLEAVAETAEPEKSPVDWLKFLLGLLPKPLLILVVLGLGGLIGRQIEQWVGKMDEHVAKSGEGYQRLQAVEAQAKDTASDVNDLRIEFREMRKDQLGYYRWQAQQWGDRGKVREFQDRLNEIEAAPAPAPRGAPTPVATPIP